VPKPGEWRTRGGNLANEAYLAVPLFQQVSARHLATSTVIDVYAAEIWLLVLDHDCTDMMFYQTPGVGLGEG
jgi:hypothetical protein